MASSEELYLRRASLLLIDDAGERALDLSEMHFQFRTAQQDEESPSNCYVRVWNLSEDTMQAARAEYAKVVLQAGYAAGPFGVIFQGTIKQFRIGKEPDGVSTFLDILAADGDLAYNFSVVRSSSAAGSTAGERIAAAVKVMEPNGASMGQLLIPATGGVLPRGKVLFGLARGIIRQEAAAQGATWTINDGRVNVVPLDGYLPGEAVVLNADTGLIGRVDQTEDGMQCRCLLNPKITVGGLVKIDNASINQTEAAPGAALVGAQLAYNKYAGLQRYASISADGLYRVYVAEYVGDTRGNDWYVDLVCLEVDAATLKVRAKI
jgi:hypothetical protein